MIPGGTPPAPPRPRRRRGAWASLVLRALGAVCLALVPLGILERSPFAPPLHVLVLDDSPSVRQNYPGFPEEALRLWEEEAAGARRAVIGVGERPRPVGAPAPAGGEEAGESDLPAALRAAAGMGTPRVETRVLLATDGLGRSEGLGETIRLLRASGTRVWGLTPPRAATRSRAVRLVLPERVFLWEPFTVRVRVEASRPGPVTVRLSRNGSTVAEAAVTVDVSGSSDLEFPQELDRVGRVRYAAAVAGSEDPPAEGEVRVALSPRVHWLSEDPASSGPLVGFYRGAGLQVELSHPADLTFPERDLARAEVIVLDDLPEPALTGPLLEALRRAVGERGAGLLVLGGRKGLGSGGYAGTALEEILPVRAGFRTPPPPPAVAMVLALDTSFSMAFRGHGGRDAHGGGPRKIDVAKESVKEVVRIVRPGDRLGILGNSTEIFWIAPLGEVADRQAVADRVERVGPAGDGIYFYSVLTEARRALAGEPGGLRHLLILCDAGDIDQYEVQGRGHAFDLLREMSRDGITVSILAIGAPVDKDVPFLRTAALLGRGDFYLVPQVVALPRYFVSEYRRLSSAQHFVEEQVRPVAAGQALPAGEAAEGYPLLDGIALMTAREGGRTLLQSTFGAPLLVLGRYGRGRTAAFAGDNGYRWAARWVGAAATRRLWLKLVLDAAPSAGQARDFSSSLEVDREADRLRLRYAGGTAGLPPWEELWALPGEEAGGEPVRLERVGLRAYRGPLPAGAGGYLSLLIAEDPGGERPVLTAVAPVPPAAEERPAAPSWDAVERLLAETGGGWVDRPEEMLAPHGAGGRLPLPPAVLFVAAGVLLLLAEVVVRVFWEEG